MTRIWEALTPEARAAVSVLVLLIEAMLLWG